ncbi:hypothetical protein JL720_12647 [Aureococcus anophagefferens]|nr:hypothetical protein JL720_12647 [Aureococcus anophagefferens]
MSALQVPSFEGGRGTELPEGWVRWVDPATDEYYYHNEETGETTWDDPTRWKVGLWLDRARGVGGGPEVDDRPPYEPRSIEHAFSQWCASEGGATSFDDDEEDDDDDDDEAAGGRRRAALDDRARRLYANLQGGPEAPEPSGPSVIVWDDHGAWHARHYDTTEEAKAAWDDLPLSHASVLFVKDARSSRDVGTADTDSDGDDDPAWAWQPLRQYGMPAVRKIRDRFANSRALRRGGRQPTERQAKKLLRPKRRALSETELPVAAARVVARRAAPPPPPSGGGDPAGPCAAPQDARDGAAAAGDVPEMRRAVVEALQSTLVLRKAKSAVSESLSATEGAKRTRGLKQGPTAAAAATSRSRRRAYGLDEKLGDAQADRFSDEWHALGKRCLARGHVPLARRYARRGVPPSLRPQIYRVLLGLPNVEHPQGCSEAEKAYYARLKAHVDKIELVTDELFQMDVQHVADNDYCFPFEEALGNVVLAFSRDPWVPSGASCPTAPLTFVYEREEPICCCLRAMYAKFWCKLNVMRTAECTLLPLCKLFEQLVIENHPKLFFYLVQIGVDPLAVALPWIQFGFVGLLDVDQVLLLWDRILGFEDLSLLPILAAAIFVYRSEKLSATSLDDVKDMFSDGSILQVVPLIQTFLFCG